MQIVDVVHAAARPFDIMKAVYGDGTDLAGTFDDLPEAVGAHAGPCGEAP